jgi:hypothetical protein
MQVQGWRRKGGVVVEFLQLRDLAYETSTNGHVHVGVQHMYAREQ